MILHKLLTSGSTLCNSHCMSNAATAVGIPEWDTADRLRKSLRESGMTVNAMAEYLEVAPETVSRWINGKKPASTQTLRLWAMKTGVNYKWLKTGQETTSPGDGAPGKDSEKLRFGNLHHVDFGHRELQAA